jgi:peroxiredoxin family protein/rhodanese-related sulfurtransferase/TusA-related sulfurtransferase
MAIRSGLSVRDLQHQELSYAPPYGSAKDPINYAGFVATNYLDGDMGICHVPELEAPESDQVLLDVRTPPEVEAGTIPGSRNIPLDELRQRSDELPKDEELLVFCQVGLRGYLACRLLEQRGFKCRNLTGGYKTYQAATGLTPEEGGMQEDMTDDTGETASSAAEADCPAEAPETDIAREIDATGLQCPGPVMRLREAIDAVEPGQAVAIETRDPAFAADVGARCRSTGNRLVDLSAENGTCRAVVARAERTASAAGGGKSNGISKHSKSLLVFSGDYDKAFAAFVIANGAASMGNDVTMFFTFWGLNVLRRDDAVKIEKNLVERMFGWMMPRGAGKLALSKMNMGGLGKKMIQGVMRKKNVPPLSEMIQTALDNGVRLVACSTSMDMMGIREEELVDGVETGGVAAYLESAEQGNVNLFI